MAGGPFVLAHTLYGTEVPRLGGLMNAGAKDLCPIAITLNLIIGKDRPVQAAAADLSVPCHT